MTRKILGLALVGLLSFSSFALVGQVNEPNSIECGGEDGKKKKKGKKSKGCCKKGSKECSKSKGSTDSSAEEAK